MRLTYSIFSALCISGVSLHAGDYLEAVTVKTAQTFVQSQGHVKDVIEKTEVVSRKEIEKKQAVSLVEAIEKSPGVDVTTNCSMCGIKRVMLNGMKGEHTTVLSDGVPFHSTVSSYYGMDALGTGDVESIEIARGSGASLTAPEAIGGTLTIISRRAKKNGGEFNFAVGEQGYTLGSFVAEGITADKKTGALFSGMYSNYNQYDHDHNGVNEAPKLENQLGSVNLFHQLTQRDLMELKVSHSNSTVYGGPMVSKGDTFGQFYATGGVMPSFMGGNVTNAYNGDPMGTMESITTTRDEATGKWTHIGEEGTFKATLAYATAKQDSMYEGTDYANKDNTYFVDLNYQRPLGESHFLTYGMDLKKETMNAQSTKFVATIGSNGHDDFTTQALGLYVQDTWDMNEKTQLNLALRGSKITTNFLGQFAKGNEIDTTIVVPRLHLRYNHNDYVTSRFSAGQGYRAPLSFFESEHGLIGPQGFGVDVTKIERSNNATYALSYVKGGLNVTSSVAYTQVKNLAYVSYDATGKPILQNSNQAVAVRNGDIVIGYALTPSLSISGGYERYFYDKQYKELLYIAAIEQRAHVALDWERDGWDIMGEATWTGGRDLSPYGYGNRFNDVAMTSPKSTKAPAFTTVDMKIAKELSKTWSVYAGVKNLFDYTQTSHESPLYYDAMGRYNVGDIWGPLRGRMSYVGIKATF
jgi:outer membrane receptor for ferrienterochelin and colicin